MTAAPRLDYEALDDAVLAGLIAVRDPAAVRLVTTAQQPAPVTAPPSRSLAIGPKRRTRCRAPICAPSPGSAASRAARRFRPGSRGSRSTRRSAGCAATKRRRAHLEGASVAILDDYREKLMQGSMSGTAPDREQARAQICAGSWRRRSRACPSRSASSSCCARSRAWTSRDGLPDARHPAGDGEDPPSARAPAAAAGCWRRR